MFFGCSGKLSLARVPAATYLIARHNANNISVKSFEDIGIPKAIKRGPTDLLRALANTVGVDPTAPHFSFIDDPSTIPTDSQREVYFAAKELGRRAARQLAEEWPTLFMYDTDHPRIEAYRPQKPEDPTTLPLTVENLKKLIEKKDVVSANVLYDRMTSESVDIPKDLLLNLFYLLVYYNGKPIPRKEITWHAWRNFDSKQEQEKDIWDAGGAADLLFEEIDKDFGVYSAMIAGLCKYKSAESTTRALQLFKEMRQKKLTPTVEAYRGMIEIAKTWEEAMLYLKDAAEKFVKPNIFMFNALIEKATSTQIRNRFDLAVKILHEALTVGCKPTLRTYSLIMKGALKQHNFSKAVCLGHLVNILERLEQDDSIEMCEKGDEEFFVNAMDLALQASNITIAERLVSLYQSPINHVRLPALTGEADFYMIYLRIVINQLPLEDVEKQYFMLVPRVVPFATSIALPLIRRLKSESSVSWKLSRRLIEDCITARHILRPLIAKNLRSYMLGIDLKKLSAEEREELKYIVDKIMNYMKDISRFIETENLKHLQKKLEPDFIADMSLLLLRLDDAKGWSFLSLLLDENAKHGAAATVSTEGYPGKDTMDALLQEALRSGDWYNASNCIQIKANYSLISNIRNDVELVKEKCKLTNVQKSVLENFVSSLDKQSQ